MTSRKVKQKCKQKSVKLQYSVSLCRKTELTVDFTFFVKLTHFIPVQVDQIHLWRQNVRKVTWLYIYSVILSQPFITWIPVDLNSSITIEIRRRQNCLRARVMSMKNWWFSAIHANVYVLLSRRCVRVYKHFQLDLIWLPPNFIFPRITRTYTLPQMLISPQRTPLMLLQSHPSTSCSSFTTGCISSTFSHFPFTPSCSLGF